MIVPKLVYKPLLNEVIEGHDYAVLHLESAPDKKLVLAVHPTLDQAGR